MAAEWESSKPGDVVQLLGGLPLSSMQSAIVELRAHREDGLADELGRIRADWERAIAKRVEALGGISTPLEVVRRAIREAGGSR